MTRRRRPADTAAARVAARGASGEDSRGERDDAVAVARQEGHRPEAVLDHALAGKMSGDAAKVKALIEADPALVAAKDDTDRTPLHWAARGTNHAVLAVLVEKGEGTSLDVPPGVNRDDGRFWGP